MKNLKNEETGVFLAFVCPVAVTLPANHNEPFETKRRYGV